MPQCAHLQPNALIQLLRSEQSRPAGLTLPGDGSAVSDARFEEMHEPGCGQGRGDGEKIHVDTQDTEKKVSRGLLWLATRELVWRRGVEFSI